MRRKLALLVAATTSLVLIAFLVPLGYLVQVVAADRAINAATREAEGIAPIVATVDRDVLQLALIQVAHDDRDDYPLTVFLPDGMVLGEPARRSTAVDLAASGRSLVAEAGAGREILVAVQGVDGGTAVVRSFVTGEALNQGVARAWLVLGALGLALLGLGVLVADRLARTLVKPMQALADVSHRLGAGELEARVRPAGPRELRAVGEAVNRLAGRIGELLAIEREAVADLSHRLRTPLTALRLDAEALPNPDDATRFGADVDALTRVVDDVIHEARRPVREGVRAFCDAAAVVADRLAFWSALAQEEDREVIMQLPPNPVSVRLSDMDLSAAVDALLGNVFAHTPAGTAFAVRLHVDEDSRVVLTITDDGPGFGKDLIQRGSSGKSTGLGLDIVRRTAEASGGGIRIGATPGAFTTGANVTVELGWVESADP